MGSKLTVTSEVGEGSTFSFYLAAVAGEEPQIIDEDFIQSNNHAVTGDNYQHPAVSDDVVLVSRKEKDEPLKILIAEDNNTNRFLIKIILLNLYPNTIFFEAKSGDETIELFKSEHPDVILMDVQMPFKSGYEATKEIRNSQNGKKIPIIACTAGALKGEKEKCLAAGMNDYVSKPIVKGSIKKVMEKWVIYSDSTVIAEKAEESMNSYDSHYNKKELRNRYGEVLDVLEDLLLITKESLSDSRVSFEEIQKLPDEKLDFEFIRHSAHRLKGTALSMSFVKLATIAIELEKTKPPNFQSTRRLLNQVIDEINYLDKNIQEL